LATATTQAGRTADDGDGRNSPYTTAFLKHIEEQEEIGTVFRRVSADVYETTKHDQLPELSLSLIGEFYLKGRLDITIQNLPITTDPCAAASDHWKSAEAIGTIAAFKDHLARFPSCAFSGLAKARLQDVENKVAVAAPPVQNPSNLVASPPASGRCDEGAVTVSLAARACPLSVAEERSLAPKDVFRECEKCPEMVVVPAGKFMMGSPEDEKKRYKYTFEYEGPQHAVTIARPLAVGKYHVTVDQFAAFIAETHYNAGSNCALKAVSWMKPGFTQTGSDPVVCVSWEDAKAYIDWLAKKTGKGYRLLSEAEWEYAARAGTTTRYFFGNDENEICRYGNGSDPLKNCDGYKNTSPAGHFPPNGFGLYDMLGNAEQWLEDCWHKNYVGAPSDGSAWTEPCVSPIIAHGLRGGSWMDGPSPLRSASRSLGAQGYRTNTYGFRLARTLAP
jgi:formylglycine-generating enzyme required for sulfatase activity